MKVWVTQVGLLAAAMVAYSGACAGETAQTAKAPAKFEALDKNSDRQISRTEAGVDRALSNGFAILDANGDGFLSAEEYAARSKS